MSRVFGLTPVPLHAAHSGAPLGRIVAHQESLRLGMVSTSL
jgi:hypothetical protein